MRTIILAVMGFALIAQAFLNMSLSHRLVESQAQTAKALTSFASLNASFESAMSSSKSLKKSFDAVSSEVAISQGQTKRCISILERTGYGKGDHAE